MSFAKKLAAEMQAKQSVLFVAINPSLRQFEILSSASSGTQFCWSALADKYFHINNVAIDAVAPYAVGIVVNPTLYVTHNFCTVLESTIRFAHSKGLMVIRDDNFAGTGSDAAMQAAASIGAFTLGGVAVHSPLRSDAVTVSGFGGEESVTPFVDAINRHGTGAFVTCKTASATGSVPQGLITTAQVSVWEAIARMVAVWGNDTVNERGYPSLGIAVNSVTEREVAIIRTYLPKGIVMVTDYDLEGGDDALDLFDGDVYNAILVPRIITSAWQNGDYLSARQNGGYLFDTSRLRRDVDAVRLRVNGELRKRLVPMMCIA